MVYEIILQSLWLILPAYIANGCAALLGGGTSIDFGKNYKDGKRILGDGKTWRGLILGTLFGMIGGFGLSVAAKIITPTEYNFIAFEKLDFTGFPIMIPIVFSICFGALFGDMVKSFFKRRCGIERGKDWVPFDQIDFILGVLFLSLIVSFFLEIASLTKGNWFFDTFSILHIVFLLFITPFFHVLGNFLNNKRKSRVSNKQVY
jgi:CDP-2,3-bis-(O-geranylgeranyl)-sn-glycerol synthase